MIRVLLVVGAGVLLAVFLASGASARVRAGRRLLFIAMILVFIGAALQPDAVTAVARAVGVGRGADLVLYILATAFLYLVLFIYQKFKDQERRLAEVVRQLALVEASLSTRTTPDRT